MLLFAIDLTLKDIKKGRLRAKRPKIKVTVPLIRFSGLFRVLPDLLSWLGGIIGGLSTSIHSLGKRP